MAVKSVEITTDRPHTESFVWAEDYPVRRAAQNAVLYNDGATVHRRVMAAMRDAMESEEVAV